MKKIKKIIFSSFKLVLILSITLFLLLFFYTIFFYDPNYSNEKIEENEIINEIEKVEKKVVEDKIKKKTPTIIKKKEEIKDGLYATVGNRAITRSDIYNEVKMILIISNTQYNAKEQNSLQRQAVRALISRNLKQIEIEKNSFLEFNENDLMYEIKRLADNIGVDIKAFKKIFETQDLDFALVEDELKTKLLWNSLIFHLYRDKLSINLNEIDETLKSQKKIQEIEEFLISEILLKAESQETAQAQVDKLLERVKINGFKSAAMELSISETSTNGGDLGWLDKNNISKSFIEIIENIPIGEISKPILLKDGILFFTVRDKRIIKKQVDLELLKNNLVNIEKNKILDMYSMTHYDNLKRSIGVNFF